MIDLVLLQGRKVHIGHLQHRAVDLYLPADQILQGRQLPAGIAAEHMGHAAALDLHQHPDGTAAIDIHTGVCPKGLDPTPDEVAPVHSLLLFSGLETAEYKTANADQQE